MEIDLEVAPEFDVVRGFWHPHIFFFQKIKNSIIFFKFQRSFLPFFTIMGFQIPKIAFEGGGVAPLNKKNQGIPTSTIQETKEPM